MKRNAKVELLKALPPNVKIKCASIVYGRIEHQLKVGYTDAEYEHFLGSIDFEYEGVGLNGIVWLEDGTWLTRELHFDLEWWEWNTTPPIPPELVR